MRVIVTLTSILVLLVFTVLLPPGAFFDPNITPDEVQIPDERPCEDTQCKDKAVYIDDKGLLQEVPNQIQNKNVPWPRRLELSSQFVPLDIQRPPSRS